MFRFSKLVFIFLFLRICALKFDSAIECNNGQGGRLEASSYALWSTLAKPGLIQSPFVNRLRFLCLILTDRIFEVAFKFSNHSSSNLLWAFLSRFLSVRAEKVRIYAWDVIVIVAKAVASFPSSFGTGKADIGSSFRNRHSQSFCIFSTTTSTFLKQNLWAFEIGVEWCLGLRRSALSG